MNFDAADLYTGLSFHDQQHHNFEMENYIMATAKKTQIEKIETALRRYNTGAGVTADKVASMARVPREAVAKRVSDLRDWGYTIYTNYRNVNGKRTAFYRIAD
jgi:biotin operon repressor